jgi:hypothetical protein
MTRKEIALLAFGVLMMAWGIAGILQHAIYSEMGDYEYQPGTYRTKVYTIGQDYLTVGTPAEVAAVQKKIGYTFKARPAESYEGKKAAAHGWIIADANADEVRDT